MKNILITGGPTAEPIDEVMRVTTFSTGSLSVDIAKQFLDKGDNVTLVVHNIVDTTSVEDYEGLTIARIETTDDMLETIKDYGLNEEYHVLFHTSAVGDYKSDFTFLLEDVAEEIFGAYERGDINESSDVLKLLENPKSKLDDSSKISSYQKNLTVKLGLTPKIIARLREWFPNTILIGCKLLEDVSIEELVDVAKELCIKNDMDYILANDLAKLNKGHKTRYLVDKDGFTGIELESSQDIFKFIYEKFVIDEITSER